MKIDRLIGILSVLLQKDTVTAPELAAQFEVSRRTIGRDIEVLCKAGIPVVTRQGAGGGISIMEDYRMDRTVFTTSEMQDILAGLRSLDSVHGTNRYGQLMEKLSAGSSDFMTGDQSILIDLSSWYKESLAPKIERIRSAIDNKRFLKFRYFSPRGESSRRIEPYYLIFRWSSWYVWGWCCERNDFRLFKLNRMEELRLEEEQFTKRKVPLPDLSNERIFPGGIRVKAVFEADCKWRLVEEFGLKCFQKQADGTLLFQADYTDKENLLTWLLTFGDRAELLEPEELRRELRRIIGKMNRKYQQEGMEMASRLEFVQYVADQLSQAGTITYRKMFGEYGLYLDGKMFGSVCDDQFFVKITEAGRNLAPDLETAPPYEGAKPCFLIEEMDDREFLAKLVRETCKELPLPKPKKKKTPKTEPI